MVRDHPGLGEGLGTFFSEFPKYTSRMTHPFSPDARMSAHNTFLGIWAETGTLGLASWTALLGVALWTGFRQRDRFGARDAGATREMTPWVRAGLAAGLLGYTSTMVTGDRTLLREDVVMLGAWLGLATSLTTPAPRVARIVSRCAAVALAAIVVTLPLRIEAARREIPLDRLSWGFHDWETAGDTRFRWTRGAALFYVPAEATSLEVPLRSLAPFPQHVTVLLDRVPIDTLVLEDHAWHVRRYALQPRFAREGYHRVEIGVHPVWSPPDDPRSLGIVVGETTVRR
jgi:hypothetical protein